MMATRNVSKKIDPGVNDAVVLQRAKKIREAVLASASDIMEKRDGASKTVSECDDALDALEREYAPLGIKIPRHKKTGKTTSSNAKLEAGIMHVFGLVSNQGKDLKSKEIDARLPKSYKRSDSHAAKMSQSLAALRNAGRICKGENGKAGYYRSA